MKKFSFQNMELKTMEQIRKVLKILIAGTAIMLICDFIFWEGSPFGVSQSMGKWIEGFANSPDAWILGAVIWFVMWLQAAIVPIPAMIVINAAISCNLFGNFYEVSPFQLFALPNFWYFIIITISAYMVGAMTAYLLGAKFGKGAIKWCAGSEEDYNKWSEVISKKGKWWYASTVLLPVFPDDLLCLVAGSLKFDFNFFFWSNLFGRSVGLITVMGSLGILKGLGGGGSSIPWSIILWAVGLVLFIVFYYVLKYKEKKKLSK